MSNRRNPLSIPAQLGLGSAVAALRQNGWCWKRLEEQFEMSRTQLWRCQRRYERSRMQQKTERMQHQGACALM